VGRDITVEQHSLIYVLYSGKKGGGAFNDVGAFCLSVCLSPTSAFDLHSPEGATSSLS